MACSSSQSGAEGQAVDPTAKTMVETIIIKAEKKKKKVRMTQEQIYSYLAFKKPEPLSPIKGPRRIIDALSQETLDRLPKDILEGLATVDLHEINESLAEINKSSDDLEMEADDVWRQYRKKGYVEYEEEEEGNAPPALVRAPAPASPALASVTPAPGRRRHRPGVTRKSGTTKRLS